MSMGQKVVAGQAPGQRATLKKTLTLFQVVMIGLAYLQPMTLFDTFGIVSGLTDRWACGHRLCGGALRRSLYRAQLR